MKTLKTPGAFVVAVALIADAHAFDLVYEAASEAEFSVPHDVLISADRRYLYVADNGNDRIAVLDPAGLHVVGVFGEGEVGEPHDVAFDLAGRLLVADTGNSRIAIYELNGAGGREAGELSGRIRRPEGVAAHPNGRVYATGASSDNMVAYDNGAVVAEIGGLSSPHDIAIAADGSLWVADAGNDRVLQVSPDLETITVLQGAPYDFNGPRYLDFDDAGRLYVADKYSHQIKVIAPDHTLLFTLGAARAAFGPRVFDRPEGVSIAGDTVWFADTYNDRIVRYRIVE